MGDPCALRTYGAPASTENGGPDVDLTRRASCGVARAPRYVGRRTWRVRSNTDGAIRRPRIQLQADDTPLVGWDGSYWFNKGNGTGAARLKNFTLNGTPADPSPAVRRDRSRHRGRDPHLRGKPGGIVDRKSVTTAPPTSSIGTQRKLGSTTSPRPFCGAIRRAIPLRRR